MGTKAAIFVAITFRADILGQNNNKNIDGAGKPLIL